MKFLKKKLKNVSVRRLLDLTLVANEEETVDDCGEADAKARVVS